MESQKISDIEYGKNRIINKNLRFQIKVLLLQKLKFFHLMWKIKQINPNYSLKLPLLTKNNYMFILKET